MRTVRMLVRLPPAMLDRVMEWTSEDIQAEALGYGQLTSELLQGFRSVHITMQVQLSVFGSL